MERIQMAESQAREMFRLGLCPIDESKPVTTYINTILCNLKLAGYIIKNPVEEAEEWFNEVNLNGQKKYNWRDVSLKQHEAIIYLQEQLKR